MEGFISAFKKFIYTYLLPIYLLIFKIIIQKMILIEV